VKTMPNRLRKLYCPGESQEAVQLFQGQQILKDKLKILEQLALS